MCKDIETFATVNKSMILDQIIEAGHSINNLLEEVEKTCVTLDALTQFQYTEQFFANHQLFGQIVDTMNTIFQPFVDEQRGEMQENIDDIISAVVGGIAGLSDILTGKPTLND